MKNAYWKNQGMTLQKWNQWLDKNKTSLVCSSQLADFSDLQAGPSFWINDWFLCWALDKEAHAEKPQSTHDHEKNMQAQDTEWDLMSKRLLLSQNLKDLHQELSKQLTDSLTLSETQPRIIVIMHTHKKVRDFTTSPQMNTHTEKRLYQHLFQVGNQPAFRRNNSRFAFHFPKSYFEPTLTC